MKKALKAALVALALFWPAKGLLSDTIPLGISYTAATGQASQSAAVLYGRDQTGLLRQATLDTDGNVVVSGASVTTTVQNINVNLTGVAQETTLQSVLAATGSNVSWGNSGGGGPLANSRYPLDGDNWDSSDAMPGVASLGMWRDYINLGESFVQNGSTVGDAWNTGMSDGSWNISSVAGYFPSANVSFPTTAHGFDVYNYASDWWALDVNANQAFWGGEKVSAPLNLRDIVFPESDFMAPAVSAFGFAYDNAAENLAIMRLYNGALMTRDEMNLVGGVEIANQTNAPGSMPSAILSGYGQPIDHADVGDEDISGSALLVASLLYDGEGNKIWSNVMGNSLNLEQPSIGVQATLAAIDGTEVPYLVDGDGRGWLGTQLGFNNGTNDGVKVSPTNPLPASLPSAFDGDTYTSTASFFLANGQVLENYTVNADWVGSVGSDTFTATLEGSMTGAFAGEERVLGTLTESSLTLSVAAKPYPYSRVNLSAISLDTATGLVLNGVAK